LILPEQDPSEPCFGGGGFDVITEVRRQPGNLGGIRDTRES
jgi:hypothetical protein